MINITHRVVKLYPEKTDRYRLIIDDDLKTVCVERYYNNRGWVASPLRLVEEGNTTVYSISISDERAGLKGTSRRLHRLVAEHCIHNPDPINRTVIAFKDGNSLNCHPDNLKWSTRSDKISALTKAERSEKYTGYIDTFPCAECGRETSARLFDTCPDCRKKPRKKKQADFEGFALDGLSLKERIYIDARRRGKSIRDIAEIYSVSETTVRRMIGTGIEKAQKRKK